MTVSPWLAAGVGEDGIAIIALIVLWIVCLVGVQRWKDALRLPFHWLKWAIPLFTLCITLSEANKVINLILVVLPRRAAYISPLTEAGYRMYYISMFFEIIANIFILLCLVELARSFLLALGNDSAYYKIIRYSNFFIIAVLFILAVAVLGEGQNAVSRNLVAFSVDVSWATVNNLYAAYIIIYWITSLGVVPLSTFVLYSSIRKKQLRSLARRFLATSLLNLIRMTWEFYYVIRYDINSIILAVTPQYVQVVYPILYTWITVSMFGLLIAIGFKERNGLWSQQQPQQQLFMENTSGGGVFGSAPPALKPELAGSGSPSPSQQYYWMQYQQQPPLVQNQDQSQNAISVPALVEVAAQPYRGVQQDAVHEVPVSDGVEGWNRSPSQHFSTQQQQPYVTPSYELAGTWNQKA